MHIGHALAVAIFIAAKVKLFINAVPCYFKIILITKVKGMVTTFIRKNYTRKSTAFKIPVYRTNLDIVVVTGGLIPLP